MTNESDYYAVLGVEPQASPQTIRAAFAALLSNFPGAKEDLARDPRYQRILQAYKVLSNPERRASYDSLLAETMPYALTINVYPSKERLKLLKTSQLAYLLIDIRTPEQDERSQYPLNLCLVIDRSTSMQGARLNQVTAAVELILEKLTPDDTLSVVSFSDRANVVLPSQHVDNQHTLTSKVRGMRASGGTEIYQGLLAGLQEMQQTSLAKHTNHLILLTDGHTYGDAEKCLQLAKQAASHGITFSAIGIGTEWNDRFLDKLVSPSGGQSVFIERPEEIIDHLQDQIQGLGQIYARNVRLIPRLPRSASLEYGFKLRPFAQPLIVDADEIKLGDIEGGSPLTFLLELNIEPQPAETRVNLSLNFKVDIPSQHIQDRSFSRQFQFLILSDPPDIKPVEALMKAVRMINMYRMNEKVWDEVEAGHLDQATNRMRHLSTRLLEVGETKLAQQAYAETELLATMGTLSPEGRKKLKYGTRSLLTEVGNLWGTDD